MSSPRAPDFEPESFRIADYRGLLPARKATASSGHWRSARESARIRIRRSIARSAAGVRRCDDQAAADDHLCWSPESPRFRPTSCSEPRHRHGGGARSRAAPLPWKPERGAAHSYERVREQARVQVQGREESRPVLRDYCQRRRASASPGCLAVRRATSSSISRATPSSARAGSSICSAMSSRDDGGQALYVERLGVLRATPRRPRSSGSSTS